MAIKVRLSDIPTVAVKIGEVQAIRADFSDVIVRVGNLPQYTGEYTITPKTEEQTMATANKQMTANVVVKAIPRYDVSNLMGGITVSIAKTLEQE